MAGAELRGTDHPVCPRCGTFAGDGVWCGGCGLNLKQQGELPTADSYAARVREQRWLAAQAEQAEVDRTEQASALEERRAAEAEHRAREQREQARARAEESASKRAERPRGRRRKLWVGLASVLVLLLGGGGAAFALLQARGSGDAAPQEAGRVAPPEKGTAAAPPAPTPPQCSRRAAQRELERRELLGDGFSGVSRVICRDFTDDGVEDAAFTRKSLGSAGTLGWGVLVAERGGEWSLPLLRGSSGGVGLKGDGKDLLRSEPIADEADPDYVAGAGAIIEVYRYRNARFRRVKSYQQPGEAFPAGFYEDPEEGAEESTTVEPDAGTEPDRSKPADPCADVEYNQSTPDYDCGYFPE